MHRYVVLFSEHRICLCWVALVQLPTLADRATDDGVEEAESCILIGQLYMTKQGLKRILCARQKLCQLAFLYMGKL
jgi:hypothetical protein